MKELNLGGFSIDVPTQRMILWIFIIYSAVVLGLALFVKLQARKNSDSKFADFMTGGGKVNFFELALITATGCMAGGTMVSGPGLTYHVGFIYTLVCFTQFISSYISFGTYGSKFAIIRNRLNASTGTQLIHHRYQSRAVALTLTLCSAIFLTVMSAGQLMVAGKIFGAVLGTDKYTLGLIVGALVLTLYSLAGGIQSMAKVSILQGAFMVFAVIFLMVTQFDTVIGRYGSIEAAMRYVTETNPVLTSAYAYTPMTALGLALASGWAGWASPASLHLCTLYRDKKTQRRIIMLSCAVMTGIFIFMESAGPFIFALNPNIENGDYAVLYTTTNLLPGWMAGVVISAIFAAIQSSIATFMIIVAGGFTSELYHDCINPEASDKKLSQVNLFFVVLVGITATIMALNPTQLAQNLMILALGGMASCFGMPVLFGVFWKKTTPAGAMSACIGGFGAYIICNLLQTMEKTAPIYTKILFGMHPLIPSVLISLGLIIVVSLMTQNRKVPLGVYRVWFCKDYDEAYTRIYNSCGKGNRKQPKEQ